MPSRFKSRARRHGLRLLTALVLASSIAPAAVAQSPTDSIAMTLEAALARSTGESQEVRLARSQVEYARSQVRAARSAALPQLDGTLAYTRTFDSPFSGGGAVDLVLGRGSTVALGPARLRGCVARKGMCVVRTRHRILNHSGRTSASSRRDLLTVVRAYAATIRANHAVSSELKIGLGLHVSDGEPMVESTRTPGWLPDRSSSQPSSQPASGHQVAVMSSSVQRSPITATERG